MKTRVGLASLGLVLFLAVSGCGSAPPSSSGGHRVPNFFYERLNHDEVVHAQTIWKHEVKRQGVRHLDAVVSFRATGQGIGSKSGTCPPGRIIRVVIRGTFPAKPSSIRYEDLYASPRGHICDVTYRKTAPRLTDMLANQLHRIFDVPNSGGHQ